MSDYSDFIRITIKTADFERVEALSRKYGGWPTNSKYDCRNGLLSTSGFWFKRGVPGAFLTTVLGMGAVLLQATREHGKLAARDVAESLAVTLRGKGLEGVKVSPSVGGWEVTSDFRSAFDSLAGVA